MAGKKSNKRQKIESQKFFHKAITYLKEEFPEKTSSYSDKELSEMVYKGCEKAVSYGLDTELEAISFVDIQWRLSQDFDQDEKTLWAFEILKDDDYDAQTKIAVLRNAYVAYEATREE